MIRQRCPNCQEAHDVSVYVTGRRIACGRCGIRFEVVREDVPRRSTGRGLESHRAARQPDELRGGAPPQERPTELERQPSLSLEATLTRRTTTAIAREPPKPPEIPGFEIVGLLGRGGMGEVWRARQLSLGREVALKTLSSHLADEPDFVRRFEKEAAALAALSHPNVVSIFDRGNAGDRYFLVMELVAGRSLRERISLGLLAAGEAGAIGSQLLAAMDYAHRRGVVHRDLKPENILLASSAPPDSHDETVKVADFGLAAVLGRDSALHVTRPAVAMGTLSYMAPEQRRDARSVDGRADLYSVGVILFEMLTGELPLGRFRLPSERGQAGHRRFDAVLERALQEEPESRYANAGEMARDLARAVEAAEEPGVRGWIKRLRG